MAGARPEGEVVKNAQATTRKRGALVAACLAIVALGIIYLFVGDSTVWGAWISVAPSIVWVVLLIPTAIRLRSWTAAIFLAVFLLTTTEWPRLEHEEGDPDDTVRLVSWNIGAGNTHYLDELKAYEPDIILIQEGMKPGEVWEGFEWYGTPDPGALMRFPGKVLPTEKVGPWTEPQLLLVNIRGQMVIVANVRLMLPSAVIQLVNPLSENPFKNHCARVEQYGKLTKLLRTTADNSGTSSIILAGDFNVPARMRSLKPIRSFLRDAWQVAGSGWGPTVPGFLPFSRVDHVWVSHDIQPVSIRAVRLGGSDHRGLVVDLKIKNRRHAGHR